MGADVDNDQGQFLIKDRYNNSEYIIDQPTYLYILDLVKFYHQSIYEFPDGDRIHVEKINDEGNKHIHCEVSINRLVFHQSRHV